MFSRVKNIILENLFILIIYLDKPLVIDLPRSSSTSSLDNIITNESVCAIQFSESFIYKNGLYLKQKENMKMIVWLFFLYKDFAISPSVWLGTSTGSIIVVNLNIIYEPRNISGII
jgi:hypothetical protein